MAKLKKPPSVVVGRRLSKANRNNLFISAAIEMDKQEIQRLIRTSFRVERAQQSIKKQLDHLKDKGLTYSIYAFNRTEANRWQSELSKMFDIITNLDHNVPARWARSFGLGGRTAAGLYVFVDVDRTEHVSQLMAYAGMTPYCGTKTRIRYIDKAINEAKVKFADPNDPDCVPWLASALHRPIGHLQKRVEAAIERRGEVSWDGVRQACKSATWNPEFRLICTKIMLYFERASNSRADKKPIYTELFHQRRHYEMDLNEKGAYKDQADWLFQYYRWNKKRSPYRYLSSGMLTPVHIHKRAQRWVLHLFLSHYLEVAYYHKYKGKKRPKDPYILWRMSRKDKKDRKIPVPNWPWGKGNAS